MNYTRDFGWYYITQTDRAPVWTGVAYFHDFITQAPAFREANGGTGPFGRDVSVADAAAGDFIQLANKEGIYYHTLVITGFEPDDILICAHSNDALNRRLSTYNYASLRFLHIDGIAVEVPQEDCYEKLLAGKALPVNPPSGG